MITHSQDTYVSFPLPTRIIQLVFFDPQWQYENLISIFSPLAVQRLFVNPKELFHTFSAENSTDRFSVRRKFSLR